MLENEAYDLGSEIESRKESSQQTTQLPEVEKPLEQSPLQVQDDAHSACA